MMMIMMNEGWLIAGAGTEGSRQSSAKLRSVDDVADTAAYHTGSNSRNSGISISSLSLSLYCVYDCGQL